jgi:hypothetical protein
VMPIIVGYSDVGGNAGSVQNGSRNSRPKANVCHGTSPSGTQRRSQLAVFDRVIENNVEDHFPLLSICPNGNKSCS